MAVAGGLWPGADPHHQGVTIDFEVPADAEIVIEGLIDPELLEPEGPFGESHGHVALEDFNMSMQVTAITHRRNPVFVSIVSQVTPSESSVIKRVAYEPMFLAHLRDQLSIKGIKRVVLHEPLTNIRPVIFLQFARGAPRTRSVARDAGRRDAALPTAARSSSRCPTTSIRTNTDAVLWSLAYRANLAEDLHVVPHRSGGHGPKSGDRRDRRHASDRRDAEGADAAAGVAGAGVSWKTRARSGTNSDCRAQAAAALARLFARRLGQGLGHLRAASRVGRMGGER